MNITDLLLPEFDAETANTRKMLERVPDNKFDWKPHEKSIVMNHMIHHRAQLGVYLRLNNIPLPAIYGPSADEGSM